MIPKLPGLTLADPDDEERLIDLLQEFCRRQRKQVEVFFDRAPHGQAGKRQFGLLTAHFVRQGTTADTAIRNRLVNLKREARNWTVVSSDQAVQREARFHQATCLSSDVFAARLLRALEDGASHPVPDDPAEAGDIDEWLRLFGGEEDRQKKKRPK